MRGQVNFPSMQLASLSTGGEMVAVDLSGGSNMRSYAVRKNDKYLVTVLNNNPAAKGGSRVTVAVPDGYRATTAAQVHAPDIDARNATELTPLIKLGGRESGVVSSKSGELAFDLVPASATTLVFEERA